MKSFVLAAWAICILPMSIFADLNVGGSYRINFVDVDGNTHSTADGRITILILTNQANIDKARAVGDRVPDFCVGDSEDYRMITAVTFENKHSRPDQAIVRSLIPRRLDSEARRLQARYDKLKIRGDARRDVSAVADFDGTVTAQLDAKWEANLFHVFVFGKNGGLLKRWNDLPEAEELAAFLKQN